MKKINGFIRTILCAAVAAALLQSCATPAKAPGWLKSSRLPKTYEKPLDRDPMRVTVHRLPNGLTVYLSPNDQEPRVTAWIAVRAGSRHDPGDSTGMAHYLEHMLFKGSRKLGTLDYAAEREHLERINALYEKRFKAQDPKERARIYKEIDEANQKAAKYGIPNELDKTYKSLGFKGINAFTSNERTVYICDMPSNRLEAWAKLEADRFDKPVFRLFLPELETVYEEKNRSLDNPGRILWAALDKNLWDGHPYAREIIGTIEHLKNPSLAKMYAYHDRFYVPNNMAIALAGDFDRAEALSVIRKYFGSWKPQAMKPDVRKPKSLKKTRRVEVQYEAEEMLYIAWPLVPKSHPDADALTVMDMVFANAETGLADLRLNQAQKVRKAGSSPRFMNEGGMWLLYALPKDGQTLEEAEALLMETVGALKKGDFTDEDLRANVLNFEIAEKKKLESNSSRAWTMSDAFIGYEEWPRKADWLKRLRKVTKADVLRVAEKYLGEGRVVAFRRKGKPEIPSIEKPSITKVDIDPKRESAFFREITTMPSEPVEPKWLEKGKDYKVLEVPSGRLFAAKNPMNDVFSLEFKFDRGRRHARGLCAALDLLDLSGGGDMSAEEFKRALYRNGISLGTTCGEEWSSVSVSGLEEKLDEALRLMRLRFDSPKIPKGALAKMVEIKIGANKDNKVNPRYVERALSSFSQRGAKSGVLNELANEELKALKEADLVAHIRSVFDYERRTGYVGTRSALDIARKLELLGGKYKPAPKRTPRVYVKPGAGRVLFLHRDMVQSKVGIFAADEVFDPKNTADYEFYTSYMGGGMSAVIFQEVREARSLAYSAWGVYAPGGRAIDENRVVAGLGTQADKTIEATTLLHGLLKDMPSSADRFREVRKAVEQRYRTSRIKFRDIPARVMRWEDLGYKGDPGPERFKRALSYTLPDLERFAERFKRKAMSIYVLGNKERVDLKSLGKMGALQEKKVDDIFPY